MTEQATDQRIAFEGAIRQMAATDPAFRAELSGNPAEALKAAFGLNLPSDFNLRVVNEKPRRTGAGFAEPGPRTQR